MATDSIPQTPERNNSRTPPSTTSPVATPSATRQGVSTPTASSGNPSSPIASPHPATQGSPSMGSKSGSQRPRDTGNKAKRAASPEWPISPFGLRYELELLDRVQCLTTVIDPNSNRYGMTKIPTQATWGTEEDGIDNTLCRNGRPVIVLLIGEVENASFFNETGQPLKFVRIAVKPMYHADVVAAHKLITHLSSNVKKDEDLQVGIVEAGRRQTRREKNSRHTIAYDFRHAYDASEQYGPKSVMPKIRAKDLGYRDLVVVECKVLRFHVEADTGKATYIAKKWASWRVRLDIVSVCRLHEAAEELESGSDEEDVAVPVI
ncbi:hypothetical protein C2E23DRAFT_866596 [Lenzites betulinus]|nr:hypothetical protein C2E23DRAFT_866596 [Lenzites betulinus]